MMARFPPSPCHEQFSCPSESWQSAFVSNHRLTNHKHHVNLSSLIPMISFFPACDSSRRLLLLHFLLRTSCSSSSSSSSSLHCPCEHHHCTQNQKHKPPPRELQHFFFNNRRQCWYEEEEEEEESARDGDIKRREKRRCESRAREEQRRGSDGESTACSRALAATYPPNLGARRLQNFITPARIFLPERGRAESLFYCLSRDSFFSPSFLAFFFS